MNNFVFGQKIPAEIAENIARSVRARRKERGYSQEELSQKSGVSFGSLKRFETRYEISLKSLIKLAIALNCEDDFAGLFARKQYQTIQDVINEQYNA